ncbi:hypothetical protein L596_029805 [Steinernema carpocapsae]|uniref:DNA-(apurinic or apyrimidinic site) lyase n=1 Tax=Steinernema carpocapsae TaxID=34508 RepID=A0A4U5LQU8_STECR|nr:hypothetical protein L596_029805 [Steinernema carpocapsae]
MSLVLVMGLPGAGKTTLCEQLKARFTLLDVQIYSFDEFLASSGVIVDGNFTEKASFLRKAWQKRIEEAVEAKIEAGFTSFTLLVDDVFYFSSMRRVFERMSRAFGLACIQILVETSLEEAILRNLKRSKRPFEVSEAEIRSIAKRVEVPYSSRGFYRFQGDLDKIAKAILETKSFPHKREIYLEPEHDDSVWKQLDLDLRKAVGTLMRDPKTTRDGKTLSAKKRNIFEKMKAEGCVDWDAEGLLWSKKEDDSVVGVAYNRVWRLSRVDEEYIEYSVLGRFSRASGSDEHVLKKYLQLDVDLPSLYRNWSDKDAHFAELVEKHLEKLEGIRILRQQLVETLFAFICSANNNIQRISKLVNTLASLYGEKIQIGDGDVFYDFPHLEALGSDGAEDMEAVLRKHAFGYRAGYIAKSVAYLVENGGDKWLEKIAEMGTEEAREELVKLPGIGRKVADCICLMALQKHEIVPVDTHVLQITATLYIPSLAPKNGKKATLNEKIHKQIAEFYVDLFGPYAGWAHSVLFSSRLKHITSPGKVTKKSSRRS